MRLGLAQLAAAGSPGESLERLRGLLARSRVEADVVLLPEYSDVNPAAAGRGLRGAARSLEENPFIQGLVELGREYGALFVAGVLERSGGCVYSSVVAVDEGGFRVVHRKHVLFDALGYRESSVLCRGGWPPRVFEAAGWRLGALVCYELRFPELARWHGLAGVELLLVPAAWYSGPLKEEQLGVLARARALENTFYVAVADQVGTVFSGRSVLVDPLGVRRLDLGGGEGYAEAELDRGLLGEARRLLPVLEQARGLLDHPKRVEEEVGEGAVGEAGERGPG